MTVTKETWEQYGHSIFCRDAKAMVCELSEPHASKFIQHAPVKLGSPDRDEIMERASLIYSSPVMYRALLDCYDYLTRKEGEAFDLEMVIRDAAEALALARGEKGTSDAD